MPLVARASKGFSFKNLMIVVMCGGAAGWFAYDGWKGWPDRNDRVVEHIKNVMIQSGQVLPNIQPQVEAWPGWAKADDATRNQMSDLIKAASTKIDIEGWKSPTDINTQKYIVYGLIVVTIGALWRFVHYARQRAIAEDTTVSPSPGVVIPWEKITIVDNARWKKMGIVDITYTAENGESRKAKFDDYELDRDALLPILDQLAEKAVNAEFLPKEEAAPADAAAKS